VMHRPCPTHELAARVVRMVTELVTDGGATGRQAGRQAEGMYELPKVGVSLGQVIVFSHWVLLYSI
jgi:hypothetical protein